MNWVRRSSGRLQQMGVGRAWPKPFASQPAPPHCRFRKPQPLVKLTSLQGSWSRLPLGFSGVFENIGQSEVNSHDNRSRQVEVPDLRYVLRLSASTLSGMGRSLGLQFCRHRTRPSSPKVNFPQASTLTESRLFQCPPTSPVSTTAATPPGSRPEVVAT